MDNQNHTLTPTLLFTIALIGSLAFLQVYSIQSILPLLITDLRIDEVTAGTTVGATVLAVALMSPFMGMLSDAIGRRWLIIGSVFFLALPTMGIFWASNVHILWWLRFLQGLAVPGITVVLIAYIGEEFHGDNRIRLMSFYVSGTVLGGFLGRFLMGYLSEFINWHTAFLIMAMFNFIGAMIVWRFLPPSRSFVAKPHISHALQTLWRHAHNRHVLSACCLGFCVLFSLVGCFTYINLHLAEAPYHLNSAELANIFAVYLLGMVITPISGRLIILFGANRTAMLAVGVSILGALLSLSMPLFLIIVALILVSTGVFITQSATINYIAYHVDEGRSLASGLYYMSYYTGGFVGSWLCGYAYAHGAWKGTVIVLIMAQLLAVLIAGVLMAKRAKS